MAVKFVAPRVPLVDLRTGQITREWYLLFQTLFTDTSGSGGLPDPTDDMATVAVSQPDNRPDQISLELVQMPGQSLNRRMDEMELAAVDEPARIFALFGFSAGILPVSRGGTGATSPANARTNLGAVGTGLTLTAGSGLSGGGDLSVNRSFSIATNGVADTMIRQAAGFSVIGRSAGGTGNVSDIGSAADGQVLRRAGSVLGFGALDLTQAAATAGILAVTKGGTGVTTSTGTGANVQATQPQFTNTIGAGVAAATSGSGVSFPATQSPSTDPNTLDDYEEGTWTPVITAGSGSFGSAPTVTGTYTKVGRVVVATVTIDIANNGTAAGVITTTLPFPITTVISVGFGREFALTGNMLQMIGSTGGSTANILVYNNGYPGGTGASIAATLIYIA